jgi:hypothetical protein
MIKFEIVVVMTIQSIFYLKINYFIFKKLFFISTYQNNLKI